MPVNYHGQSNGGDIALGTDSGVVEFTPRQIALPLPDGGDSLYALFYTDLDPYVYYPSNVHECHKLYLALINSKANNGDGEVILKDELVARDTFDAGFVSACRHANGRDWWIFIPKLNRSSYFRFLLTLGGVSTTPPQYVSEVLPFGGRNKLGLALFSPDGNKYARIYCVSSDYSNAHLELFDIDRCTGLFYNRHLYSIPLRQGIDPYHWYLAFSPSGRFLYLYDEYHILQYDIQASDFLASAYTVVNFPTPDPTVGDTIYTGLFKLGPDGVIYGSTTIVSPGIVALKGIYLSKILNPNLKGDSCNFRLFARKLPWAEQWTYTYTNTASYRAGPVDGSACDTLGIDMWSIPWTAQIKTPDAVALPFQSIYPNPASAMVSFIYSLPASPYAQWQLYNSAGQPVAQRTVSGTNGRIELDTATLPPGLYVSVFITAGGQRIAEKVVVGH